MTRLRLTPFLALLMIGGSVGTAPALAQQPQSPGIASAQPAARPWNTLSPAEQNILAPLQDHWNRLPPRKQAHMLDEAAHWVTLPAPQREEIRERIARWQKMTPEQRQQARRNRHQFHQLPAQQRQKLHEAFERFQNLPPAQRDELIRQWHSISPAQRLQWLHQSGHDLPPPPDQGLPTLDDHAPPGGHGGRI